MVTSTRQGRFLASFAGSDMRVAALLLYSLRIAHLSVSQLQSYLRQQSSGDTTAAAAGSDNLKKYHLQQ